MSRNHLIRYFREHEITNLRTCIKMIRLLKSLNRKKSNMLIGCTSSRS